MGHFTDKGLGMLSMAFEFEAEDKKNQTALLAKRFGVDKSTISRRRAEWLRTNSGLLVTKERKPPPVDIERIEIRRGLVDMIVREKGADGVPVHHSLTLIAKQLFELGSMNACKSTICLDLEALGYGCASRRGCVMLKPEHIAKRLEFAYSPNLHVSKDLLFSDESWFMLGDQRTTQWVHRDSGEEPVPLPAEKRVGREIKLMVFAIIGVGIRKITFADGSEDSTEYISMLESTLLPILEKETTTKVFMQDGASCHWSAQTREWHDKHGVILLEGWPARSPDLNPIEHFWAIFKRAVFAKKISDLEEMKAEILRVFESIPQSTVDKLVLSFPKRIAALRASKGDVIVNTYQKIYF